jgi:hypothetical protein
MFYHCVVLQQSQLSNVGACVWVKIKQRNKYLQ